ncbi:MAG: SWIM zinc finger family protein [Sulfolobales archaeon]|nr:SWIM zinc finger family protein [Sulfolobales archaeon]MCX8208083.1 SWIM zinc finger family protein [Sulfolobales archaeon]MDW8010340.1 SWIM zinc finger family protein [Sulfolobales archaeon]
MSRTDKRAVAESVENSVEKPPEKAIEAVLGRRLLKLLCRSDKESAEIYVFYGRDRSYVLIPKAFCGCKDFEINVVLRRERGSCYHLIALELAIRRGVLRVLEVDCGTLREVALELVLGENSPTLRKIVRHLLP